MSAALQRIGKSAALPQVAAVEQNRLARTRVAAQAVDQSLEMGEPAHAAIAVSGLLVIEKREGVGARSARFDPEMLEECAADEVRRLRLHRPMPRLTLGSRK